MKAQFGVGTDVALISAGHLFFRTRHHLACVSPGR